MLRYCSLQHDVGKIDRHLNADMPLTLELLSTCEANVSPTTSMIHAWNGVDELQTPSESCSASAAPAPSSAGTPLLWDCGDAREAASDL